MSEIITNFSDLNLNGVYSYADYLTWKLEERVELIKGKIFPMSPAPNTNHQRISTQIQGNFFIFLMQKPCKLFSAPFDVRLFDKGKTLKANQDVFTVVQPDLCIICDHEKIDEKGCLGAPDLIVEILSKGNSHKEMKIKYDLYEESGVLEYWIVVPYEELIYQFVLENGKFQLKKIYSDIEESVNSAVFEGLNIPMKEIF